MREEGGFWSGCLYRGIFPTLLGIAPYVGLNFAVYETLKGVVMQRVMDVNDQRDQVELDVDLPVLWRLSCGALSGAVAQSGQYITITPHYSLNVIIMCFIAVTYPLDVIRRRMQMKGAMSQTFPYRNTAHALVTIYKNEGIVGFYKGMLPNLLKVAPSVAIAFVTYEITKAKLFGVAISWR